VIVPVISNSLSASVDLPCCATMVSAVLKSQEEEIATYIDMRNDRNISIGMAMSRRSARGLSGLSLVAYLILSFGNTLISLTLRCGSPADLSRFVILLIPGLTVVEAHRRAR